MMKISIIHNNHEQPEQSDYIEIHYSEFKQLSNSTLNSIKIVNTLDYVDSPEELISVAITKMRYGAELIISGMDVVLIADKILNGKADIPTIRNSLYAGRKNISNYEYIKNIIIQLGLKIKLINLDKDTNQYLIIGEKPNVN